MSSYSSLLPALVNVLETSRELDGIVSKQSLLNSTNDFKTALANAKQEAVALPGGDLSISDQEDVIRMLEQLAHHKRAQLAKFSRLVAYDKSDNMDIEGESQSHS